MSVNVEFVDVWVNVDGFRELDESFFTDAARVAFLRGVVLDADRHGLLTEVYELRHPHPMWDEDCTCVQYSTDHRPTFTINGDEGTHTGLDLGADEDEDEDVDEDEDEDLYDGRAHYDGYTCRCEDRPCCGCGD